MAKHTTRGWIIELAPDAWRVLPPLGVEGETSERQTFPPEQLVEQAEPLREALVAAGWRGESPLLALADKWCLAARIPATPNLLKKRQALRYELETAIPWSAEDYVCDFVAHREAASMVAVPVSPLRDLLLALDDNDVAPAVVAPAALLALQAAQRECALLADGEFVWRRSETKASWFTLRDGRLWAWRELAGGELRPLAAEAVATALARGGDCPCAVLGLSDAEQSALTAAGLTPMPIDEFAWDDALRRVANALAAGEVEPIVNLRRDELAGRRPFDALRRQTRWLQLAGVLLVAAVCAALWLRGDAYQQGTDELHEELADLFEETFPEEPVPQRGLAARFRTAQQQLAGTRGEAHLPSAVHADLLLQRVLAALPTDLRYRAPEIRIEGANVYLAGEVRSNADADKLAAALRAAGGDVAAPRLQRLAEAGFAVRLTADFGAGEDQP
ncbi:MAG: hypothetical protein KDA44_05240 [Planctomycetales bacterium]|nr:hypothetical protein [Planctomycetales bacterium]